MYPLRTLLLSAIFVLMQPKLRADPAYYAAQMVRGDQLHLYAQVSANGGKPAWWLIDTGAPISLISKDLSRRMNPTTSSGAELVQWGGSHSLHLRIPVRSLVANGAELGPASLIEDSMPAILREHSNSVHGSFDKGGLIGLDLLIKRGAVINSLTQQIFFTANGSKLPLPRSGYESMGLRYVPMRLTPRRYLEIEGTIGNKLYSFVIDTGAFLTMLQPHIQAERHLTISETHVSITAPYANIEKVKVTQSKVPGFNIGGIDLSHFNTGFADCGRLYPDTSHEFGGILGPDLLVFHRCLIDIGNRAFYLQGDLRDKKK